MIIKIMLFRLEEDRQRRQSFLESEHIEAVILFFYFFIQNLKIL